MKVPPLERSTRLVLQTLENRYGYYGLKTRRKTGSLFPSLHGLSMFDLGDE
jgi:hypothetical protein